MRPDELFDLTDRVFVITGGAGLLGQRHAEAVAGVGGIPVLADIHPDKLGSQAMVADRFGARASMVQVDVADPTSVNGLLQFVLDTYGRIDGLVNNAANNPIVSDHGSSEEFSRVESFTRSQWDDDIAVGLTGAFLCSQVLGGEMARRGGGVIVNIASDLSLISPDQRLYRLEGLAEDQQPVKPISYPVVKAGLIGLTRYLATYWAASGVRVNAISPGGVYAGQPDEFVARLSKLIPLGRMARVDEYEGAILFLCSDASSYMTGHNLVVDGGRTIW
jgi:NAD(P)-dependent dehydrogenase (short-subunit alcohol dehydrogenase family)